MKSSTDTEPRAFAAAHSRLKHAQKSSKGAPAYSLYINRPVGRVIAAAAYRLGLTPNQVTYISAAFSFVGIVALATLPPSWPTGILVCLALVLGYAFDSADGQLARLRGGGSAVGEWLDHMIDCAKVSSLHLAVLIMADRYLTFETRAWLLVPLVFAVASAVHFFGMIVVELLTRAHHATRGGVTHAVPGASRARTLLKTPTDYGVLCLVFLLLGLPIVFYVVYTLLATALVGYLLLVLRKWRNDIIALDAAPSLPT